jgi:hypothetical protein
MSICSTAISRDALKPITVTLLKAKQLSGLGYTKLWELIGTGELQTVRVGRRRLIIYESLCRLLAPDGQPEGRLRGRPRKAPAHGAAAAELGDARRDGAHD